MLDLFVIPYYVRGSTHSRVQIESFIPLYEWDYPKKKSKKKGGEGKAKSPEPIEPVAQLRWPYSQISAFVVSLAKSSTYSLNIIRWAQVDEEGKRFLLGDSFGHLALLALVTDHGEKAKLGLLYLGEACSFFSLD